MFAPLSILFCIIVLFIFRRLLIQVIFTNLSPEWREIQLRATFILRINIFLSSVTCCVALGCSSPLSFISHPWGCTGNKIHISTSGSPEPLMLTSLTGPHRYHCRESELLHGPPGGGEVTGGEFLSGDDTKSLFPFERAPSFHAACCEGRLQWPPNTGRSCCC